MEEWTAADGVDEFGDVVVCEDRVRAQYHSPASSAQQRMVSSYDADRRISSPVCLFQGCQVKTRGDLN